MVVVVVVVVVVDDDDDDDFEMKRDPLSFHIRMGGEVTPCSKSLFLVQFYMTCGKSKI